MFVCVGFREIELHLGVLFFLTHDINMEQRLVFLLVAISFFGSVAFAQLPDSSGLWPPQWRELSMPQTARSFSHPYLWAGSEDHCKLKKRLKIRELDSIWNVVRERALLQDELLWDTKYFLSASLVYYVTGDTAIADRAIAYFFRSLRNTCAFVRPEKDANLRYMNFNTGNALLNVAVVYDMLHARLSSQQKDSILRLLKYHLYPPFIEAHYRYDVASGRFFYPDSSSDWWTSCYFGWNSKINGAYGLAALATLDDIPESRLVLEMARLSLSHTFPEFDQGTAESGGWDEGIHGLANHLRYLILFYTALERVFQTDDGFFALAGVEKAMDFYMQFLGPDKRMIPFGLSFHRAILDPPSELYYLALRYNNPSFADFIEQNSAPGHALPFAILWRPTYYNPPDAKPSDNLLWFTDIDYALLSRYRLTVPVRGGDNAANAANLDAANLLVYLGDQLLISDPGWGHVHTTEHNCVLINEKGQIRDDYRMRDFGRQSATYAPIEQATSSDDWLYLLVDATACYEGIARYRRHIVLCQPGHLIVVDEALAEDSTSLQTQWHSSVPFAACDSSCFQIQDKKRGLRIQTVANSSLDYATGRSGNMWNLSAKTNPTQGPAIVATMFTPFALLPTRIEAICSADRTDFVLGDGKKSRVLSFVPGPQGLLFKSFE